MESNKLHAMIDSELEKIGKEAFRIICRVAAGGLRSEDDAPGLHTVGRALTDEEAKIAAVLAQQVEVLARGAVDKILSGAIGDRKELISAFVPQVMKLAKSRKGLSAGRKAGAASNTARANAIKDIVILAHRDLLLNPTTSRWTVRKQAIYIVENVLMGRQIEIEGKKLAATMANGKRYRVRTIEDIISKAGK